MTQTLQTRILIQTNQPNSYSILRNTHAFLDQPTNFKPHQVCSAVEKTLPRAQICYSLHISHTRGARGDVYITWHPPTVLQRFKNALCHHQGTCRQVDKGSLGVWGTAARELEVRARACGRDSNGQNRFASPPPGPNRSRIALRITALLLSSV